MHPPAAPRPNWAGRRIVLGCIGRKERWKGTDVMLDAYDEMLARGYPVELRVAFGNIPADRPEAPFRTEVMPRSDQELADFYRSLDVMLATGTLQLGAAHYPVMEAMACGVPVVTTGYYPAKGDNAWLVPARDPSAIADAVRDMLERPVEREQRVARAHATIRQFDWSVVAERMLDVFRAAS